MTQRRRSEGCVGTEHVVVGRLEEADVVLHWTVGRLRLLQAILRVLQLALVTSVALQAKGYTGSSKGHLSVKRKVTQGQVNVTWASNERSADGCRSLNAMKTATQATHVFFRTLDGDNIGLHPCQLRLEVDDAWLRRVLLEKMDRHCQSNTIQKWEQVDNGRRHSLIAPRRLLSRGIDFNLQKNWHRRVAHRLKTFVRFLFVAGDIDVFKSSYWCFQLLNPF